jgi:hypothetical protein
MTLLPTRTNLIRTSVSRERTFCKWQLTCTLSPQPYVTSSDFPLTSHHIIHMESSGNGACGVRIMLEKSCWTCRNRHVKCDQSPAPCAKCRKAGLECFKKLPLRWVKGVAIRGKMQGHIYEYMSKDIGAAVSKKTNHIQFQSPVVRASIPGLNGTILKKFTAFILFGTFCWFTI